MKVVMSHLCLIKGDEMASVIIYSTAGSSEEANKLAEGVVAQRIAACVQMLPIRSIYRWQGKVEHAEEVLLLIKTRKELADKVIAWLKEHHSYEVPEAVAVDIAGGLDAYLRWIEDETEEKEGLKPET